ncbi:MAG: cupin domain-containing protein [Gammaproteobacteria bacterium]|jgi:mannose-6-phosphate isomerase-like protein (cupin superfamily)|nr:cupin domain-containing protein [Gammaproteobacteria bacterium]
MTTQAGPFDIGTTRLVINRDSEATPVAVTDTFFEDLDTQFEGFAGYVLISRFEFDADWPTWEIHPHGDEVVYLLEGDTDFVLETDEGEKTVRVSKPGEYVVVPRGTWHTARPRKPTSLLFVTPGEGTRNRDV